MPAWEVAVLAGAAFTAGTVDAIAGGGGLITLPTLLAVGLPPHQALGTNKAQSVWGSAAALVTFVRAGAVDRGWAPLLFALGLLGAFAGAAAVLAVTPGVLRPVVIVLLTLAALVMIVRKPAAAAAVPANLARRRAVLLAAVIGAYDGFFGPGTGTFLIVGFVAWCGLAPERATANAKVVNFASNLAALAVFASRGQVVVVVAAPMALAQLAGGVLGARLALRGGARLVRAAVIAVSAALIVKLALDLV